MTQWLDDAKIRSHKATIERVIVWADRKLRFGKGRVWMVKAEKWKSEGHKSQDVRCRIANRMTRIVFKMVSGRQLYRHPSRLDRGYVMDRVLKL